MRKLIMTTIAAVFTFVGTVALIPTDAEAIPVFARKYGMSCNSCHTMFPKLSKMGVAFRERGFRFAPGKDDFDMQNGPGKNVDTGDESPAAVFASNFPFTLRTQVMYSGAGPITDNQNPATVVMPGTRMGMLDGGLVRDANGLWSTNRKIGFGELGLISSGSYDNFGWWIDANQNGISMAEGLYYFNDLIKVRVGRVQNDVGYGMTMMSRRPLGYGSVDAAQMAGGTMLMMGDGISIHGTTNGDSGVGTLYNFSAFTYGKNVDQNNQTTTAYYGRVAQEFDDNYIVGIYGYRATNWNSDAFGGENQMLMAMGAAGATTANVMQFKSVARYGVDFAMNYGEPFQVWGAFTMGSNSSTAVGNEKLNVRALTVAGEYIIQDGVLFGVKLDQSRVELKMGGRLKVIPKTTTHLTAYGLYQVAQNVQGFATYTKTRNLVTSMGGTATQTVVRQQSTLNTLIVGLDIAL